MTVSRDVLKVGVESDGEFLVASLVGALDEGSQHQAESMILPLLATDRKHLLLEASGLTFVSSAGLRVIISAVKVLKPRGGSVSVCAPQPTVEQLLRIAGLTALIRIHPSVDAARSALNAG
jgi:anti-anti-sigma factor